MTGMPERARDLPRGPRTAGLLVVGLVERPHQLRAAIACHPHAVGINPGVEVPAAAMLLQEGGKGGEQLRHCSLHLRPTRVHGVGEADIKQRVSPPVLGGHGESENTREHRDSKVIHSVMPRPVLGDAESFRRRQRSACQSFRCGPRKDGKGSLKYRTIIQTLR